MENNDNTIFSISKGFIDRGEYLAAYKFLRESIQNKFPVDFKLLDLIHLCGCKVGFRFGLNAVIPIKTFTGHQQEVRKVAISNNNKLLLSIDGNTIRLWDIETGDCINYLYKKIDFNDSFENVGFDPSDKFGIILGSRSLFSLNLETFQLEHGEYFGDTIFLSSDYRFIAYDPHSARPEITIIDRLSNKENVLSCKVHGSLDKAAFSKDGRYIFVGDGWGYYKFFELSAPGKCLKTFKTRGVAPRSIYITPDNKYGIVSGGYGDHFQYGKITIYKLIEEPKKGSKRFFEDDRTTIMDLDIGYGFQKINGLTTDGKYGFLRLNVASLHGYSGGKNEIFLLDLNRRDIYVATVFKDMAQNFGGISEFFCDDKYIVLYNRDSLELVYLDWDWIFPQDLCLKN